MRKRHLPYCQDQPWNSGVLLGGGGCAASGQYVASKDRACNPNAGNRGTREEDRQICRAGCITTGRSEEKSCSAVQNNVQRWRGGGDGMQWEGGKCGCCVVSIAVVAGINWI